MARPTPLAAPGNIETLVASWSESQILERIQLLHRFNDGLGKNKFIPTALSYANSPVSGWIAQVTGHFAIQHGLDDKKRAVLERLDQALQSGDPQLAAFRAHAPEHFDELKALVAVVNRRGRESVREAPAAPQVGEVRAVATPAAPLPPLHAGSETPAPEVKREPVSAKKPKNAAILEEHLSHIRGKADEVAAMLRSRARSPQEEELLIIVDNIREHAVLDEAPYVDPESRVVGIYTRDGREVGGDAVRAYDYLAVDRADLEALPENLQQAFGVSKLDRALNVLGSPVYETREGNAVVFYQGFRYDAQRGRQSAPESPRVEAPAAAAAVEAEPAVETVSVPKPEVKTVKAPRPSFEGLSKEERVKAVEQLIVSLKPERHPGMPQALDTALGEIAQMASLAKNRRDWYVNSGRSQNYEALLGHAVRLHDWLAMIDGRVVLTPAQQAAYEQASIFNDAVVALLQTAEHLAPNGIPEKLLGARPAVFEARGETAEARQEEASPLPAQESVEPVFAPPAQDQPKGQDLPEIVVIEPREFPAGGTASVSEAERILEAVNRLRYSANPDVQPLVDIVTRFPGWQRGQEGYPFLNGASLDRDCYEPAIRALEERGLLLAHPEQPHHYYAVHQRFVAGIQAAHPELAQAASVDAQPQAAPAATAPVTASAAPTLINTPTRQMPNVAPIPRDRDARGNPVVLPEFLPDAPAVDAPVPAVAPRGQWLSDAGHWVSGFSSGIAHAYQHHAQERLGERKPVVARFAVAQVAVEDAAQAVGAIGLHGLKIASNLPLAKHLPGLKGIHEDHNPKKTVPDGGPFHNLKEEFKHWREGKNKDDSPQSFVTGAVKTFGRIPVAGLVVRAPIQLVETVANSADRLFFGGTHQSHFFEDHRPKKEVSRHIPLLNTAWEVGASIADGAKGVYRAGKFMAGACALAVSEARQEVEKSHAEQLEKQGKETGRTR